MYKKILRLTSILFVGLFLVTACNKKETTVTGTGTSTSKIKSALEAAEDAKATISSFTVAAYANGPAVFMGARALFKTIDSRVKAAKSEAKEDGVQSDLSAAETAIDGYMTKAAPASTVTLDTEKTAATGVCDTVINALKKADTASKS